MDKATRYAKKFARIAKANGLRATVKVLKHGRSYVVVEQDANFTTEKLAKTRRDAEAKLCQSYWHLGSPSKT